MDIARVCLGTVVAADPILFEYDIPATGSDPQTFPAESTYWITAPAGDGVVTCQQIFTYVMNDGSAIPEELTLDSSSGVFTLRNDAANKNTYVVDLTVEITDGIEGNSDF